MKLGKTLLYLLIILLLLGGGAFIIYQNQQDIQRKTAIIAHENETVPVRVAVVDYDRVSTKFTANGTLAPYQEMMLSAEMPGKVKQILVDEGDRVRSGQVLAKIEKNTLQVNYSSAQAAYQNALTNNRRLEDAYQTGGVTKQQLDQSRLRLKTAKNKLEQAEIQLNNSNVKTLIAGIINKRMIEPGAIVAPGAPLFQIVNVSKLKLNVTVEGSRVGQLEVGDKVKVKVNVYSDAVFHGRITFIAPLADASLSFPVEITLANKEDKRLRAGMYATAIFGGTAQSDKDRVLTLPKDAFVGGINSRQVFVVQPDTTVQLKKVVIGRVFEDAVEIVGGLQPGTKVVTKGQINLFDGSKVSIAQ